MTREEKRQFLQKLKEKGIVFGRLNIADGSFNHNVDIDLMITLSEDALFSFCD
jgi:hypothetical protein